jgi:hypothetical protein
VDMYYVLALLSYDSLYFSFMLNVQAQLNSIFYLFSFSVDKLHFISKIKKKFKL